MQHLRLRSLSTIFFLLFTLLPLLLASVGCQSTPLSRYENVKMGMEKDDVLDLMGSPQRTERLSGKDRWTYFFYDNKTRLEREVQFQNGLVTYFGEPMKPAPDQTAEARDKKNLEAELLIQAEQKKNEEDRKKAQLIDPDKNLKGEIDDTGKKKVRYMPDFVEVK